MSSKLDIEFKNAFKKVSETKKKLPTDVLLRLYAYYKQAEKRDNINFNDSSGISNIRNAFKLNAIMQVKGISEEEAKQEYINLTNYILK